MVPAKAASASSAFLPESSSYPERQVSAPGLVGIHSTHRFLTMWLEVPAHVASLANHQMDQVAFFFSLIFRAVNGRPFSIVVPYDYLEQFPNTFDGTMQRGLLC